MTNKGKYILYSVLEYLLTFGGTGAIVVFNYIDPDTSTGYKLSFTGILLILIMVMVAKSMFEHSYQNKMNDYLQALASTSDTEVKNSINESIDSLKIANATYQKITTLLPLALMLVVCYLAIDYLKELTSVLEACMVSMGGGAVFNVVKVPLKDKIIQEDALKKVNKKVTNS